jgi:hypothetical protein
MHTGGNSRGVVAQVSAKILVGVKAFRKKNQPGPLILGFTAFVLTISSIIWRGAV